MVSQAGGLALRGMRPVVHSFASFLSGRPHEQVLTNSTEGTRILYVGSLAGIVPGGPGHSHQAVTDIASFAAVHGLLVVEPGHPDEIAPMLDLLLDEHPGSAYVRLTSPPVELGFDWPAFAPRIGIGTILRRGDDVTIVGSGPIVLRECWSAADLLAQRGVSAGVIAHPWANTLDDDWWGDVLSSTRHLVVVDNHAPAGGLGANLLVRTALAGWGGNATHIAVDGVPVCGSNDEVLGHHGLDAAGIAARILRTMRPS